TFGLGWRVNGNATMTPTVWHAGKPANLRSHWLEEDATFGLGWRVNGNATMTPTVWHAGKPANLRSHWL
ncbi:hypothetical protein KXZ74_26020, partial [Escherichia coli]|nr:hypothetical protein [Escherichia coli]